MARIASTRRASSRKWRRSPPPLRASTGDRPLPRPRPGRRSAPADGDESHEQGLELICVLLFPLASSNALSKWNEGTSGPFPYPYVGIGLEQLHQVAK